MKEPTIRSLLLKRFRSLPSEQIDFGNPTFLVGRNGSGKSNIVSAFDFLAEAMANPLKAVFDRRGGIEAVRNRTPGPGSIPPNLGICVSLGGLEGDGGEARYAFEVKAQRNHGFVVLREHCSVRPAGAAHSWFDRTPEQGFRTNVGGLGPSLDPTSLALPVVGGEARFAPVVQALSGLRVYSIQPDLLRGMQEPDSGSSLQLDGRNATSVLQEIGRSRRADLNRIIEILGSIVPGTRKVTAAKHGKFLSLELLQEWESRTGHGGKPTKKRLRLDANEMSDGTLRAVGLLAAVFQRPTPTLIILEEPEATIHPGAIPAILDLIRLAGKRMQVVVTTHSPELLDASWIEPEHLRLVTWHDGATRVLRLGESARSILGEHLSSAGDLMRSDLLERHPELSRLRPGKGQASLFETPA